LEQFYDSPNLTQLHPAFSTKPRLVSWGQKTMKQHLTFWLGEWLKLVLTVTVPIHQATPTGERAEAELVDKQGEGREGYVVVSVWKAADLQKDFEET
jgi:hypothetical protein